jgi:protease-4
MEPSFQPQPPVHRPSRFSNPLIWLLGFSALIFVLLLGVSALRQRGGSVSSTSTPFLLRAAAGGRVAVLELKGVILDSKKTLTRLDRLAENEGIAAVVLRLNSPGGSVAPSQEIYEAVKAFPKPLVVSMGAVAASGAYYIATGAKKVYANPGTLTGSIGVIMEFLNLEKLYEWAKVDRYSVKTGPFKDIGAEYRKMSDAEKALLQNLVGDILSQFREAVVQGRGLDPQVVERLSDGRIFSGRQAYQAGLVDALGTLQDAIQEAATLAGIKGKPRVVYVEKPKSVWERVLEESSGSDPSEDASSLGGSASPFFSFLPAQWGRFGALLLARLLEGRMQ